MKALVVSWDVGHNPLGRAYMLAEVVSRVVQHTVIAGFQFSRYGNAVWEPLKESSLPVITIPGRNFPDFIAHCEKVASLAKPDVVIACKPRLPSMHLGMRIRDIAGCPLILDIDDHELSFFKDDSELTLDELEGMPEGVLAGQPEPFEQDWTRLAQSLIRHADARIVSNAALQERYGGTVIPHVRDERVFNPERVPLRADVRKRLGIPAGAKVLMFLGTPRLHKGVRELAKAIQQIDDPRYRFVIVGTPDRSVRNALEQLAPDRMLTIKNQPFATIPEIISAADVVALPQDTSSPISQYQLPAKAIDAIAMGVPLLVSETPPFKEIIRNGLARPIEPGRLAENICEAVESRPSVRQARERRSRFLELYSYHAASERMRDIIEAAIEKTERADAVNPVDRRLVAVERHALSVPDTSAERQPAPAGRDIVLFWKQHDTTLYGRRHDMVIKYLESRPDIRRIIVFDAPISWTLLDQYRDEPDRRNQARLIYSRTQEKLLGLLDTKKTRYRPFAYSEKKLKGKSESELFVEYVHQVLNEENVDPNSSIFWLYPRNYFFSALLSEFSPASIVVDVVDDQRTWPQIKPADFDKLTGHYKEILQHADVAFANCAAVQSSMSEYFSGIRLVPNGCDPNPPRADENDTPQFRYLKSWPGKKLGYIGNLESKIDIELLELIVKSLPDHLLVMIGSTHTNPAIQEICRYPNVLMTGAVPYGQLGSWVSQFDVGLIPHKRTALTETMNPLKQFVYASYNLPVVATDISNIDRSWNGLLVARDHQNFLELLSEALDRDWSIDQHFVKTNSWERRLERHVDEVLGKAFAVAE